MLLADVGLYAVELPAADCSLDRLAALCSPFHPSLKPLAGPFFISSFSFSEDFSRSSFLFIYLFFLVVRRFPVTCGPRIIMFSSVPVRKDVCPIMGQLTSGVGLVFHHCYHIKDVAGLLEMCK